jgi:hypothetical protein
MKKWIIALVLIVAGGICIYYYINRPVSVAGDQEADFKIPANELYAAFEANEAVANTKFTGKIIEVVGPVSSIDILNKTIVVDAGSEMFGISCEIADEYIKGLQVVKPGDSVTVKGECAGFQMDVLLVRSSLRKK